jgi:hypothetical protein
VELVNTTRPGIARNLTSQNGSHRLGEGNRLHSPNEGDTVNTRTATVSAIALGVAYLCYLATRLLELGYVLNIVTPSEFLTGGF